jgi:hypothetical protein
MEAIVNSVILLACLMTVPILEYRGQLTNQREDKNDDLPHFIASSSI